MPDIAIDIEITEFALFGSVVRPEEFREDSDVDVLVRFADDAKWGLGEWIDMRDELIVLFGREVDLLTRSGIRDMRNCLRREAILETAVIGESVTTELPAVVAALEPVFPERLTP